MQTKKVVEGLLFSCPTVMQECLELLHIITDERDYKPIKHDEYYFLKYFTHPYFIAIADKQWYVYIIGECGKHNRYEILEINGFNTTHISMARTAFNAMLYKKAKQARTLFLPNSSWQRVIFLKPDWRLNKLEEYYIFNRLSNKGTLFTKADWNIAGANMYDMQLPTYEISMHNILVNIFEDIDEGYASFEQQKDNNK